VTAYLVNDHLLRSEHSVISWLVKDKRWDWIETLL